MQELVLRIPSGVPVVLERHYLLSGTAVLGRSAAGGLKPPVSAPSVPNQLPWIRAGTAIAGNR